MNELGPRVWRYLVCFGVLLAVANTASVVLNVAVGRYGPLAANFVCFCV